jgi:hypothetical protein
VELACPGGRTVIPELLGKFLEKVGADGLEVVAEEVMQAAPEMVNFSNRANRSTMSE